MASKIRRTICVRSALALHGSGFEDTFSLVGIATQSLGTDALVTALLVDAMGAVGTRGMRTLVIVHAALEGISCMSSFAHTLWRIRWGTLGIDTAGESFAWV